MTARTARTFAIGLISALLAAGCGPLGAGPGPIGGGNPTASDAPGFASPDPSASSAFKVSVTEASYGTLAVTTAPGSTCLVLLTVSTGYYGEKPPSLLPQQTVTAAGVVRWTYAAPRVPNGAAQYTVTCHKDALTGNAFGSFDVPAAAPLRATAFTARVTTDSPSHVLVSPDPSLVPLRDAVAAKMKATLATEWKSATRGLGGLTLVDQGADIQIQVVAAKGTSVHRQYPDDQSQDVVVYVSDRLGPQSVENAVATALHELGHIWCCYGPGTYPAGTEQQGHWLTNERSPGLYGPDKYGLMTDPVTCITFGTFVSCPNRFRDREMTALGFTSFPPPVIDACVSQALSLKNMLANQDAQVATMKAQLDAQSATLTSLDTQIQAIKAQYPSGNYPPAVAAQFNTLVAQYNPLVGPYNQALNSYNALVGQRNSTAAQLNALPCDAS
jgi:hypothetical protein